MTEDVTKDTRGLRKVRIGTVVSDAQDKTIVIRVDSKTRHTVYKKIITRSKKYYAHDEADQAKVGDTVRIVETRPLSKLKRWRLLEIVRQAEADE
jgi:small subunit ribosomal protein S17